MDYLQVQLLKRWNMLNDQYLKTYYLYFREILGLGIFLGIHTSLSRPRGLL